MNKQTRQFLLTGPPGCGKTTLVKKVTESLKELGIPVHGFFTEEVRNGGKRQGFDVITMNGQRAVLARTVDKGVPNNRPMVGQYAVHKSTFEQAVLPLFSKREDGVQIIDEIGKMELFSKEFGDKVTSIFKENCIILATIPIKPLPFVNRLKSENPSAYVIEVDQKNRMALISELTDMIKQAYTGLLE